MVVLPDTRTIKRKKSSGSGLSSFYFPLTNETGLKVFYSKMDAERCYAIHKLLFDKRSTRSKVPAIKSGLIQISTRRWAYAVETVEVWNDNELNKSIEKKYSDLEQSSIDRLQRSLINAVVNVDARKIPNFKKLFKNDDKFEYYVKDIFYDGHDGNFGFRKNKLVWIDFSIAFD